MRYWRTDDRRNTRRRSTRGKPETVVRGKKESSICFREKCRCTPRRGRNTRATGERQVSSTSFISQRLVSSRRRKILLSSYPTKLRVTTRLEMLKMTPAAPGDIRGMEFFDLMPSYRNFSHRFVLSGDYFSYSGVFSAVSSIMPVREREDYHYHHHTENALVSWQTSAISIGILSN